MPRYSPTSGQAQLCLRSPGIHGWPLWGFLVSQRWRNLEVTDWRERLSYWTCLSTDATSLAPHTTTNIRTLFNWSRCCEVVEITCWLADWGNVAFTGSGTRECISVICVSHCRSVRLGELLFCLQQMVHLAPSNCDPLDRLGLNVKRARWQSAPQRLRSYFSPGKHYSFHSSLGFNANEE